MSENHDLGVFVASPDTFLTAEDLLVERTKARTDDGEGGRGVQVVGGATFSLSRGFISENREVGLIVGMSDTVVDLADVVIV